MKICPVIILQALLIILSSTDETQAFQTGPLRRISHLGKTTIRSSTLDPFGQRLPTTRLLMNTSSFGDDSDPVEVELLGKNRSTLMKEAETLRARAKAIYAEAAAMEAELQKRKSKRMNTKNLESDALIDVLFLALGNSTSGDDSLKPTTALAERLKKDRWSTDQVLGVVDRIFQRQAEAMGQNMSSPAFKIGNAQNMTIRINETEYDRLAGAMDALLDAAAILDRKEESENTRWSGRVESAVRSRISELKRTQQTNMDRWVAAEINRVANSTNSVEAYVRQTFGHPAVVEDLAGNTAGVNASQVLERIALVPMWVPSAFLPFIISCQKSTLGSEQVESIINDILTGSRFYVTSHESVSGAALFRGNIRTPLGTIDSEAPKNDTAEVFCQIQDRLEKQGLSDDVQLFLLPDPEWRPGRDDREPDPKPVLLALSKAVSPDESVIETSMAVKTAKKLMYPVSIVTTFLSFVVAYSLNVNFFDKVVNKNDFRVLKNCIVPTIGIFLVQAAHEAAHYFVAKRKKLRIGFPVPIPSFQLGMFGCITPLRSFPRNRSDLFDFALAGPLISAGVSLACIMGGIVLSTRASPVEIANFPVVPALALKSSFLIGSILSWLASKTLMLPLAQPVPVHPLFMVGYAGLFASGLNLLPIFRLDGGRACSSVFGQRLAAAVSVSMLLFLFSCALSGKMGTGFSWILLITIFQRRQEIPARDEVTQVNKSRLWLFVFSVLLSVSILTPFPGGTSLL